MIARHLQMHYQLTLRLPRLQGTLKTQAILTMGDEDDEEDEDTEGSVELGDEDTDDEE